MSALAGAVRRPAESPGQRPGHDVRHRRLRVRGRLVVVTAATASLALALFVLTMMLGSFQLGADEVVGSVLGLSDDSAVDLVVRGLRLPVALTALAVGLAFGMSGLVFQQLLDNPLAAPDFVGVSAGASLAAVVAIVVLNLGGLGIAAAALGGAAASSLMVYLLAWRHGVSGYRFILVGIGISELLLSLVGYVVARADLYDAREAMTWLVGSVGQAGPTELQVLSLALVVLVPAVLLLQRPLRTLELGDDTARALGSRVELCRLGLIGVAVALVAFATAAAGPLAFVALVAGPIARRLLGPAAGGAVVAGLVGAVIVLSSELVSAHVLPSPLPTGVITGAVGAPYLVWLLATVNREGRGG